ncbi:hypothetical protein [Pseudomonas sp. Irchel 3H9]|uniref:hypothetical protein n=1 Tax=Pseudomonas sp. Irchel 3H9 TaxID=2009043 RepID=UPI000BA493C4|nr:hypothetical protein [Pseudomonas sp. Irchel 3H9]
MDRSKSLESGSSLSDASDEFGLFSHPLNDIDRDVLKAALIAEGEKSQERFPELCDSLLSQFRASYPPHIIAMLSAYGLQVQVGDEGVSRESMMPDVQQHHVEILQALALTIPHGEWGQRPAKPLEIQKVVENVKALADAFIHRRFLSMVEERDASQQTILMLQERLRAHTQFVRNWGYFAAVSKISKELYSPLDQDVKKFFGFSATDLIDVSVAILKRLEERSSKRMQLLQKIFRSKTKEKLVKRYFAIYPYVEGNPSEFLKGLPKDIDLIGVAGILQAHSDMVLPSLASVEVEKIAELTKRSEDVVLLILNRLSLMPGDLDRENIPNFFLSNPTWIAPGINIAGGFFFPVPQVIFSNIHAVMRSLLDDAGLLEKLKKRRAIYLEEKIKDVIEGVFPTIKFALNAKWVVGQDRFETDFLGQVDRAILIVEAKSAALTPQGLRGAPDRVKRHVRDLIVEPAEQSHRLEQILWKAKSGDADALKLTAQLGLVAEKVDTIIRISVTLDDFSVICSAEAELKRAGWVPEDLPLAPTLNIADLACVAEILNEPAYFLHYFAERERIQKSTQMMGDEMDYLGLYLETGFNSAVLESEDTCVAIVGMSRSVDHFYNSADAGVRVRKPKVKLHPHLERIVLEIQRKGVEAWTTMVIDMLRIGDFGQQTQIFKELENLKISVQKNYQDPYHLSSMIIEPPAHREASVVFYVYPKAISERRNESVSEIASNVLEDGGKKRCVVVGRMIEEWTRPYQFLIVATPPVN